MTLKHGHTSQTPNNTHQIIESRGARNVPSDAVARTATASSATRTGASYSKMAHVTPNTPAVFLPAPLQVRVREAVLRSLLAKHVSSRSEDLWSDVLRHMKLPVYELSDVADISFLNPYLQGASFSASERDRLTRNMARVNPADMKAAGCTPPSFSSRRTTRAHPKPVALSL